MQPVLSAGKHVVALNYWDGSKCGKTYNRCKARENTQPELSARKRAGGGKRGKAYSRLNAGKFATGDKRGKNVQPVLGAWKHAGSV